MFEILYQCVVRGVHSLEEQPGSISGLIPVCRAYQSRIHGIIKGVTHVDTKYNTKPRCRLDKVFTMGKVFAQCLMGTLSLKRQWIIITTSEAVCKYKTLRTRLLAM